MIIERINSYEAECLQRLATEEKIEFEKIGEALNQVELEMKACASRDELEKISDRIYMSVLERRRKFYSALVQWSSGRNKS